MEWIFWGWLKALLQYAFYPVVANAYVFVFGQLLIHFVDSHPPPYDGATLAVLSPAAAVSADCFHLGSTADSISGELALYRALGGIRGTDWMMTLGRSLCLQHN